MILGISNLEDASSTEAPRFNSGPGISRGMRIPPGFGVRHSCAAFGLNVAEQFERQADILARNKAARECRTPKPGGTSMRVAGFTLIEIMIVVAIMGIIMGISIPFAWRALKRDAFNQTMVDLTEMFANARAQAILQGSMAEVVIHKDTFEISAPAAASNPDTKVTASERAMAQSSHSARAVHLTESVGVAALKISGVSYMQADEARVRFFPNGTSDEVTLVLVNMENREMRGINLEVTTGLATIESDQNKLLKVVD